MSGRKIGSSRVSPNSIRNLLTDPRYRPATLSEICTQLKVRGGEKKKIRQYLLELQRKGEIVHLRNHRYIPAAIPKRITGKLQYNRRGFGFVVPEDGSEDIFVPAEGIGGALHGDRVTVEIGSSRVSPNSREEGRVREVLTRGIRTLVGQIRFRKEGDPYLVPFGQEIPYPISVATPLPREFDPDLDPVVAVRIDWKNSESDLLRGNLEAILGRIDDPRIDSLMVIHRNDLPQTFPKEAIDEARRIPESIPASDLTDRKDLRHLPFVTIDGADARDHDDAVALDDDGTLWVSIADVSHYVLPDRPLDREAAGRGNSFYFPDCVLPMLPERLSNDLCSLRPDQDRLCLAARLRISADGALADTDLFEAVIHSRARLTYEGVDHLLVQRGIAPSSLQPREKSPPRPSVGSPPQSLRRCDASQSDDLVRMLAHMLGMAEKMFAKRMSEGGIDFDLSETKVILDKHGVVTAMSRRERTPAQRIVEEFMLAANKGVARTLTEANLPAVYRVHEKPDPRKLTDFLYLLRSYGYTASYDAAKADPIELDRLLHRFDNDPRGKVFSYLALRSMRQAYYSPNNVGHYGLGFRDYLHFTSPIRRYADLVVHRLVRDRLKSKKPGAPLFPNSYGTLENLSAYISAQERLAQIAEREIRLLKGIRFLKEKRGATFSGYVVGMVSQGLFVELEEHAVEGFVHVSKLTGDHYDFFDREKTLKGRRHGKTIRLGDRVTARVDEASLEEFRLNFSIVSFGSSGAARGPLISRAR